MAFEAATYGALNKQIKVKINEALTSGSVYKGTWNASTNTPTLTQGSGTNGNYYEVSTGGSWDNKTFLVGDRVIFSSNTKKWERVATGKEEDEESPMIIKYIKKGDTLPTTRTSGKSLVIGDYCKVDTTSELPFNINDITIDSYQDEIKWNGTAWQLESFATGTTAEIKVDAKDTESISGAAESQQGINKENAIEIKKIIQDGEFDKETSKLSFTKYDTTKMEVELKDVVITDKEQTLTKKTINADDNTITELTGANLKKQSTDDKKKTWVVQDDGTWALGKAGSDTDNETIEEANEKLQLKDNGIKFAKLNSDMVQKTIRDKDTATDTTLATEKAIRTELDELPIRVVETLPTENINQKYLYKLKTENSVQWYDGSEWVSLTAKTGMLTVETLPTGTDIQKGMLYKLTKNVEHTTTDKVYTMNYKEYTESEETIEDTITHNDTTDKWYYGETEITVETVDELPEATENNENNYYLHNKALYRSTGAYKTIVDYYKGVYTYFGDEWRALYSSDVTVNYNNVRYETLPTINGVKITGDHSSIDYNIYSKTLSNATFQKKEINKIDYLDATTVQEALEELRKLFSTVFKVKGNKEFETDLPTENVDVGDVWVCRFTKKFTTYIFEEKEYTINETPLVSGYNYVESTGKWYLDGDPIQVINADELPTPTEELKGSYYYVDKKLYLCTTDKTVWDWEETYTQYWYSGEEWNILGVAMDTTGFEKVADITDKLKVLNATMDLDGSALKYNSINTYCKVVGTLNTPVTDLQSADRELLTFPDVITIPDQSVNLKVQTHEGQFTANENISELPTTHRVVDKVWTIKEKYIETVWLNDSLDLTSEREKSKTTSGYFFAIDTVKFYKDGAEITVEKVDELPEAKEENKSKYYATYKATKTQKEYVKSNIGRAGQITYDPINDIWIDDKMNTITVTTVDTLPDTSFDLCGNWYLCSEALYYYSATVDKFVTPVEHKGVTQDFNAHTGQLIYDHDGATPRIEVKIDATELGKGKTVEVYQLKVDAQYGCNAIGYKEQTITDYKGDKIALKIPIFEIEKVSLTSDEEYIKLCAYADSGCNVNGEGVYGHYTINESDTSKKYSLHSEQYGLLHGFSGEVIFTPDVNEAVWQTVDNAYIKNNKLYCRGNITIDKIRLSETM